MLLFARMKDRDLHTVVLNNCCCVASAARRGLARLYCCNGSRPEDPASSAKTQSLIAGAWCTYLAKAPTRNGTKLGTVPSSKIVECKVLEDQETLG
jgi:hypothetical protein